MIATYLLHPLNGLGYQFFSGIGSSISEWLTLIVAIGAWCHHNNCIEKGCLRKGHKDPEHGHPVCRRHKNHPHPAFGGSSDPDVTTATHGDSAIS